jgi:hypothetical protein
MTALQTRPQPRRSPVGAVAVVLAFSFALAQGLAPFFEPDVWWHLYVGRLIRQTHHLTQWDPAAPFAAHPYVATQWLPELVASFGYQWAGAAAIVWLRAASILTLTAVLYATCRQRSGRLAAGCACLLALFGAGGGLNPRPQLVSFVAIALLLWALERSRADQRNRWWLIGLFWLWGCCHGLWSVGLALAVVTVLAEAIDSRTRRVTTPLRGRLALLAASTVALMVTPLGPKLLLTPFDVAANASTIADEWKVTPLDNPFAIAACVELAAIALLWLVKPSRRSWRDIAHLGFACGCILWMWRLVPVGTIVAAPLLASAIQDAVGAAPEPVTKAGRRLLAGALAALLAAAALFAGTSQGAAAQHFPGPMGPVDTALDHLPSHTVVLDDFAISGWLLWRHTNLAPVADLRGELYDLPYLRRYQDALAARPDWQTFVAKTGARAALLSQDSALADALVHRLHWRETASASGYRLLAAPGT